mmetsp:Transcript_1488/g.6511  ORF Transcript_1488/g.6511 Transcript_1488/m.6511 type:complete len:384 (+) Transcript_1488:838-1989(+)
MQICTAVCRSRRRGKPAKQLFVTFLPPARLAGADAIEPRKKKVTTSTLSSIIEGTRRSPLVRAPVELPVERRLDVTLVRRELLLRLVQLFARDEELLERSLGHLLRLVRLHPQLHLLLLRRDELHRKLRLRLPGDATEVVVRHEDPALRDVPGLGQDKKVVRAVLPLEAVARELDEVLVEEDAAGGKVHLALPHVALGPSHGHALVLVPVAKALVRADDEQVLPGLRHVVQGEAHLHVDLLANQGERGGAGGVRSHDIAGPRQRSLLAGHRAGGRERTIHRGRRRGDGHRGIRVPVPLGADRVRADDVTTALGGEDDRGGLGRRLKAVSAVRSDLGGRGGRADGEGEGHDFRRLYTPVEERSASSRSGRLTRRFPTSETDAGC